MGFIFNEEYSWFLMNNIIHNEYQKYTLSALKM